MRARKFWERKESGESFDEEGEGMGWSPPKSWCAWPLPQEHVPREGEVVGLDDGIDAETFRRGGEVVTSERLEEELIAVTLRFAKERFTGREEAGSHEDFDTVDVDYDGEMRVKAGTQEPHHGDDNNIPAMDSEYLDGEIGDTQGEEQAHEPLIKEPSEPPPPRVRMKPIISADDERSAAILRPSIRHTLSKLHEVLMALHYARETCHRIRSRSAANADDETVQGEDTVSPVKKSRGRPRKYANLSLLPKQRGPEQPAPPTDPELFRTKKTHRGRPQKVYPHLEGESQQEYLIRIARLQKKPLPSFATVQAPSVAPLRSPSAVPERSRKSPARRATSEELKVSRQQKLGLRDWSEVLGSAALVGFQPDVIARATQRCADMFGECMTMITLPEVPFAEKKGDLMTTYQPEEIPDLGTEEDGSSDDESDESSIRTSRSRSQSRKRMVLKDSAKEWRVCPIEDCPRQNRGFRHVSELRRHLEKFHKKEEDDIDELLDDDQETDGAVHVDGFLKPIRQKRGIRGKDKVPRKRGRWAGKTNDSDDEEKSKQEESAEDSSPESGVEQDSADGGEGGGSESS